MLEKYNTLVTGNVIAHQNKPYRQSQQVCLLLFILNELKFLVPVPTYILGPSSNDRASNYPDMKGCELCENVIYLGKYLLLYLGALTE